MQSARICRQQTTFPQVRQNNSWCATPNTWGQYDDTTVHINAFDRVVQIQNMHWMYMCTRMHYVMKRFVVQHLGYNPYTGSVCDESCEVISVMKCVVTMASAGAGLTTSM